MSGKFAEKLDSSMVHQVTAWIGVFGFMVGLTAFLIVRMWFAKAIDDFNNAIIAQGSSGPKLIASAGNGFVSAYIINTLSTCALTGLPVQWCGLPTRSMLFLSSRLSRKSTSTQQLARAYRHAEIVLHREGYHLFSGSFGHSNLAYYSTLSSLDEFNTDTGRTRTQSNIGTLQHSSNTSAHFRD